MEVKQLINNLNGISEETIFELKDGTKFSISDIKLISSKLTYKSFVNLFINKVDVSHNSISLEKFIEVLKRNRIVSSSFDHSIFNKDRKSNPSRNVSKFIYKEILLETPLKFTCIKPYNGDKLYIKESMVRINNLIDFVNGNKPIYNLINNSDKVIIWFDQLDKTMKDKLLSIPINLETIIQNKTTSDEEFKSLINYIL